MDIYQAIYGRKSIRSFDSTKDIAQATIMKLLKAACQAPSAGNLEPWKFLVIRAVELRKKLVHVANGQSFVAEAPVVIVVCIDLGVARYGYGTRGKELYAIQDTAAAIENILLAAYAEGLGSCWVGAFDEREAIEVLSLSAEMRPVAIIPLGHPRSERTKPLRRHVDDVVRFM